MKIAIIGAGITGLTTALTLRKCGIESTVYERATALNEVGAGIWLQPNAMKILNWLGLGERLRELGAPITSIEITNRKLVSYRNSEIMLMKAAEGQQITSIHRARLQQVLFEALPVGTVHFGRAYEDHVEVGDAFELRFSEGTAHADLILGADGIHSQVRQRIFPGSTLRYSGQTCWRGISDHKLPKVMGHKGREAWGKGLRFGFSAISEREVYWFAVALASEGGQDENAQRQKMLQKRFADFHPFVCDIIRDTPRDKIFRHDISDLRQLPTWHKGKILLIGDAAHATTPNMGQGACQGIEDAWYLSHILRNDTNQQAALAAFVQIRREKVTAVVRDSWRLGKMAHSWLGRPLLILALKWAPEKMLRKRMQAMYHIDEFPL